MAYKQAYNRNKKLRKTFRETRNKYGAGVWYDDDHGFYRRYTASNTPGYAKLLRRRCNKKIRQSNDTLRYGKYRKVYDYKWVLF